HVQIDGWRLKSLNHSHAPSTNVMAMRSARTLTLTSHLHRAVLPQNLLGGFRLLGRTLHPDSVIAVTEARVVTDLHREARDPCVHEKTDHRRQAADEYHDLEAEDRVRHP